MNNPKLLWCLFLFLFSQAGFAQTPSITTDSILLKITISTTEGKPLKTKINFENLSNHKVKSSYSNQDGKADCMLATGFNYSVKIPGSDDSYEYEIPDFSISPLAVNFKFNLRPANRSLVGIQVLNNHLITNIDVISKNNPAMPFEIKNDTAYLDLQADEIYSINVKDVAIKNNTIKIKPEDQTLNYVLHFTDATHAELVLVKRSETAINIIRTDLAGKPVSNDPVSIRALKGKKDYSVKTGSNGSALIVLQVNEHYSFSLTYFPGVFDLAVGKDSSSILTNTVRLKFPSVKQYELQKKEVDARAAKRDSLYALHGRSEELSLEALEASVEAEVKNNMEKLKKDPLYFERQFDVICAVLARNDNKWRSKMIVTDVTGSMYPYIKKIALWHKLELMNKVRSDYVFFNDGDRKADYEKVIGKTGGIYFNLAGSAQDVSGTMYNVMANGNGGDTPENDIEALLAAIKVKKAAAELILIADNYSPIKDIELLDQVTVPVRVILCGTTDAPVNTDCLRLAYKTGGSIHTIEEDIINLALLHDNEVIRIGREDYRMLGGYFFLVKKM